MLDITKGWWITASSIDNPYKLIITRVRTGSPSPQEFRGRGGASSLPNSQVSSFNDDSNSLHSQDPPFPGAEEAHLLHSIPSHGAITPSTSISNKSSQEAAAMEAPPTDQDVQSPHKPRSAEAPTLRQHQSALSSLHYEHIAAPKRMANGELKSPGHSLPTSPVDAGQYGHSRNSSRTSRGSQISDLSSQLRTRLSYAMVKVQNGWQFHNINELEFITSNQASPTPALADRRRPYDELLAIDHSVHRENIVQPFEGVLAPHESDSPLARSSGILAGRGDARDPQGDQPMPIQIGASYESFWREHEGGGTLRQPGPSSPIAGGPSLGPPVDISSRYARRANHAETQPPPIHTRGLHTVSNQQVPVLTPLPATPPPKRTPKMRTPSQQAAVEKDAVETLLFMSSPGNSSYHPPITLSSMPLGSGFVPQASNTNHPSDIGSYDGRSGENDALIQQKSQPKTRLSDAEIDKMLDEMPETSSSDDDGSQDQRALQLFSGR